jgi:hypothetical protein
MCDYYSPKYGYICINCLMELKANPCDIATFMGTPKSPECTQEDWEAEVDAEFISTHEDSES